MSFFSYKISILFLLLIRLTTFSQYPIENIHKDLDKLFTIVSESHEVKIGNHIYEVDMRTLLIQTAGMESNFARDKYSGRVAKTYLQIEEKTAKWYLSQVPELKTYMEIELGRKLIWNKDEDAIFIAYILYMSKVQQHTSWLNKFRKSKYFTGDIEWYMYKIFHNSIKGKSKYKKWKFRANQYFNLRYEMDSELNAVK